MTEINMTVELGLPGGSAVEKLTNGDLELYAAIDAVDATGGSITTDGDYKVHTFTSSSSLVVKHELDAEYLIIGGGGGGSSSGGGAGGYRAAAGYTISVGTKAVTIGGGGNGAGVETQADAGVSSSFDGLTSTGGAGGADTGNDGTSGASGAGGGSFAGGLTNGGGSTWQGNNGGSNGSETGGGIPAGGGGGSGSAGGVPTNNTHGGVSGTGTMNDISGVNTGYCGGGGGGVFYAGTGGGGAVTYGGGTGGNQSSNGTGGARGGGGGGAGNNHSGGSGGGGQVVVRYELGAQNANFNNWTETYGTGWIYADTVTIHGDTYSAKMMNSATMYQEITPTVGNYMRFGFYSYGTGTAGVTFEVKDMTNSSVLASGTGNKNQTWVQTSRNIQVPVGCLNLRVTITAPAGVASTAYVDDITLGDLGATLVWEEVDDVLASPNPSWTYGISGTGPNDLVAGTGIADMVFDNADGYYSPERDNSMVGFEEGVSIRIILNGPTIDPLWEQEASFEDGTI